MLVHLHSDEIIDWQSSASSNVALRFANFKVSFTIQRMYFKKKWLNCEGQLGNALKLNDRLWNLFNN